MADNLDQIQHFVLPNAGGAPWIACRAGMLMAAIQVSRSARNIYKSQLLYAQTGFGTYPIPKDSGASFLSVRRVCVCGIEYQPTETKRCEPQTGCYPPSKRNTYFIEANGRDKVLYLYPPPVCEGVDEIEIEYSYSLDVDVCDVPQEMIDLYFEALIAGGLMHVYRQKNEKWYDLSESRRYEEQFKDAISKAKSRKQTPYQPSRGSVSPILGLRI